MNINKIVLKALKELKTLVDNGNENKYSINEGICGNVFNIIFKRRAYCIELDTTEYDFFPFKYWPEYSGDFKFPVKCPLGGEARFAYLNADNMWVGEYGEARKRLLDFLINYYTGLC